ncbi:hypothetical protein ATANTOWER_005677 [Ataeniobius toweri]|uniref:Uncharacterized protein n=1 Tax=Ataeniobius toweri TaxID=208326 RepID=A0ABU7AE92_9TELE|nr:hypothetical protein [Ataeniobius toweri]
MSKEKVTFGHFWVRSTTGRFCVQLPRKVNQWEQWAKFFHPTPVGPLKNCVGPFLFQDKGWAPNPIQSSS